MYMMNVSMGRRSPCPRMHGTPSPMTVEGLKKMGFSLPGATTVVKSRKRARREGRPLPPLEAYVKTGDRAGLLKKAAKKKSKSKRK